jgi:crossover junction endodeoxyribonuclease RusA
MGIYTHEVEVGQQLRWSDGAKESAMTLTLPWPPTALSPNARTHWAKLAKAKKQYRSACAWTAASQGAHPIDAERLHLTLEFVPPTRRAFDLDNALARIKSGLDGLADVLMVDDSKWSLTIKKAPVGVIGGFVRVSVEVV